MILCCRNHHHNSSGAPPSPLEASLCGHSGNLLLPRHRLESHPILIFGEETGSRVRKGERGRMADEGEDTESLQGLLPTVNDSPDSLVGENGLISECDGLEGPFQTHPGSEEMSDTDRLCENHNEEGDDGSEELQVVGEAEVAARPMASCEYRLQFSHGGEGGLLPVPEHGPLPTQEQPSSEQLLEGGAVGSEMVMASSAASETVETHRWKF